MTLDDAVEFFNSYLRAEHEEEVAVYSEPDEVLAERRTVSESFMNTGLGVGMRSVLGRAAISPEELAESAATVQIAERTLFLVSVYDHPSFGELFAAYVGGSRKRTSLTYEQLLYAASFGDDLKIVSKYMEDFDAVDESMRWSHMQGAPVGDLSMPVAAKFFTEPRRKRHREDWQKMKDAAT